MRKLFKIVLGIIQEVIQSIKNHRNSPGIKGR